MEYTAPTTVNEDELEQQIEAELEWFEKNMTLWKMKYAFLEKENERLKKENLKYWYVEM
jgi:uncharacterized membrane protein YgaE (UPF0421/DUF939 family)